MPSRRALMGLGACLAVGTGRGRADGARPSTGLPSGPLRHEPGDLYFTDAAGKPVYLAGIHTWPVLQDRGPAFDWPGFLALQERISANLVRMWAIDGEDDHNLRGPTSPLPFARTADGRFDLTRFDDTFFRRMRERAAEAGERGIHVIQMLFNGFSLQFGDPPRNPFDASPWKAGNNVNGINGDPRGTGTGADVQTLNDPAVTALQEAYVRRVVDALDDLPNVLFEVSNETANTDEAWDWQERMLGVVKRHDALRGPRRPAGLTAAIMMGDRSRIDARLAASGADWTSPDGLRYQQDPPAATGAKVSIVDSDHVADIGRGITWVWRSFARGHNVLFMDALANPNLAGRSVKFDLTPQRAAAEDAAREGIRQTRMVSEMIDLRGVRSHGGLSSTGYALADPADGDFVVYAPEGGKFSLDLSGAPGKTLAASWLDLEAGTVAEGGAVEGGSPVRFFEAPTRGPAALVLRPAGRAPRP